MSCFLQTATMSSYSQVPAQRCKLTKKVRPNQPVLDNLPSPLLDLLRPDHCNNAMVLVKVLIFFNFYSILNTFMKTVCNFSLSCALLCYLVLGVGVVSWVCKRDRTLCLLWSLVCPAAPTTSTATTCTSILTAGQWTLTGTTLTDSRIPTEGSGKLRQKFPYGISRPQKSCSLIPPPAKITLLPPCKITLSEATLDAFVRTSRAPSPRISAAPPDSCSPT